ncbi:hypothetical protein N7528_010084 [Penicillium herquei]|nr:hypothetical protein N7528_010084 [Penicillium herquei]
METESAREGTVVLSPDLTEYAPVGSICKTHNLYEKFDCNGKRLWDKEMPTDLAAPAENSESSQYALVVRYVKSYSFSRNLRVESISVQSDRIKNFLDGVFRDYPKMEMSLKRVEFDSPFTPFIHRWDKLIQARDEIPDPITKEHVDLLHEIIFKEIESDLSEKDDLVKNGVITADMLSAIFEPGDYVFSVLAGHPRVFLFKNSKFNRFGHFEVECQYIDYDGEKFGYCDHVFEIPFFVGTLPITALPVFPIVYHKDADGIRGRLIARGKVWESYKGYHFKQYEGLAYGGYFGQLMEYQVTGRVVVDTKSYKKFNRTESVYLGHKMYGEFDDNKHLISTPSLRGYALKEKKWLRFDVDSLSEIVWDDRAFDSLVLPHADRDMKRLILACVQSKSKDSESDSFDDVIKGKGRSIIMLLQGPPGVGKTLTAESIAEVMKVPLYVLSAGDLGSDSSDVESNLSDIMGLVPRWGAVLLIDEADVFMEARDSSDLKRNELVSIFLRLLEYYEGILFLTTNRAENIDPAFESRIHVTIRYPDLSEAVRRQIWTQFISTTAIKVLPNDELDSASRIKLNGRQIKNVIRTAHLLAQYENSPLKFEHIQMVLNVKDLERSQD